MKNKTIAAWLTFLGGPLGLHRFYLFGLSDLIGWALPFPSALCLYGFSRVRQFGLDDQLSWVLIPLLGFVIAGCALNAIVYGLTACERWNERFNPTVSSDAATGRTSWFTVGAVVASLLVGTTILMGSIVYGFQRYFEYQIEAARALSQ